MFIKIEKQTNKKKTTYSDNMSVDRKYVVLCTLHITHTVVFLVSVWPFWSLITNQLGS